MNYKPNVWHVLTFSSLFVLLPASLAHAVHHGPYLGNPAQDAMTVSWVTDELSNSIVRYAPASNPESVSRVRSSSLVYVHHVRLTGLEPNTVYFYQVESRDLFGRREFVSPMATFRTAVRPGEPFRFVLKAETHNPGPRGQEAFAPVILRFNPNVIIDPGDHVDDGEDSDQWQEHYRDGDEFLIHIPVIHAWGNHDWSVFGLNRLLFDPPGTGRWYATTFGNTLFIALDTNAPDTFFIMAEQKRFLEQELQQATDGVDDPTFIVVAHHLIPYGAGPHQHDPFEELARQELVPLYERYGVDMVLTGHEKLYIHSVKDGVHYFSVCTGDKPRPISNVSPHVEVVNSSLSILEVEVHADVMKFWGRDVMGQTIEVGSVTDNRRRF
jgi:hypothetical protein